MQKNKKKEHQQPVAKEDDKRYQTYERYVIKIQCIQCLTGFYSSQGRGVISDNAPTQSPLKQVCTHIIKIKKNAFVHYQYYRFTVLVSQ